MNQCKNCNKKISEKRKYCSLKCRNIYVNLHIRDYTKLRETCEHTKQKTRDEYSKNPKTCLQCNCIIPYEKKSENTKFCSHSCSATYSNSHRKYIIDDKIKQKISKGVQAYYKNNKDIWYTFKRSSEFGLKNEQKTDEYKQRYMLYESNPKRCIHCNKKMSWAHRNRKYCNKKCRLKFERKDMDAFKIYQLDCKFKFNLKEYPEEFDFSLIKKYGWYLPKNRGNNLNGISRDHMYSIKDGFVNNVDPKLISHPANCKLVRQKENSSKWYKSSITLDELKERIKKFEAKYLVR